MWWVLAACGGPAEEPPNLGRLMANLIPTSPAATGDTGVAVDTDTGTPPEVTGDTGTEPDPTCPWAGSYTFTVDFFEHITGTAELTSDGIGCATQFVAAVNFTTNEGVDCVTVLTEQTVIWPDGYIWTGSSSGVVSDLGATNPNPPECEGEHRGDTNPFDQGEVTVTQEGDEVTVTALFAFTGAFGAAIVTLTPL